MEVKSMDKRMIAIIVIIAILIVGVGYGVLTHQDKAKPADNKTVNKTATNNTTIKNATVKNTTTEETEIQSSESSSSSESGEHGYCAICGRALSASEAGNEYTQGKVCSDCAANPDYQSGEGADYANRKLYEAYPDEYAWMYEDTNDNPRVESGGR